MKHFSNITTIHSTSVPTHSFVWGKSEWYKIAALVTMLVVALISGYLPLRYRANTNVLSIGNALAAGVFLSAGMCHMLPDSLHSFDETIFEGVDEHYPLGELLAVVGFVFVLFVEILLSGHDAVIVALNQHQNNAENVVVDIDESEGDDGGGGASGGSFSSRSLRSLSQLALGDQQSNDDDDDYVTLIRSSRASDLKRRRRRTMASNASIQASAEDERSSLLPRPRSHHAQLASSHVTSERVPMRAAQATPFAEVTRVKYYNRLYAQGLVAGMDVARRLHAARMANDEQVDDEKRVAAAMNDFQVLDNAKEKDANNDDDDDDSEEYAVAAPRDRFNPTPYILLIVLSLHAFIAGLALGLSEDTSAIAITFIAIISHKATAAVALGISLLKSGVRRGLYIRLVILFSITTPTGVGCGMALTAAFSSAASQIAQATAMSIGAGTFVYIASVVVAEEFEEQEMKVIKFLALFFGFCVMSAVAIVA